MSNRRISKFRKWSTGYRLEDGVTQSMLSAFLACRRRMLYELAGWESVKQKSSLRLGSMAHDVLHQYHLGIIGGKVRQPQQADRIIRGTVDKCLRKNLKESSAVNPAEEMELEAVKARAVLEEYVRWWTGDLERDWEEVEATFDVQFHGFRLRGRMDGLYRRSKRRFVLYETKTFSRMNEDELTDKLSFDFQCLFYLTALLHRADGMVSHAREAQDVLYNMIRVPQLVQGDKETSGQFVGRIREDVRTRPEHYFKRFDLNFPPEIREEFEDELLLKLREFETWLGGHLATYKTEGSCFTRWSCPFVHACASGRLRPHYAQTRILFRELLD